MHMELKKETLNKETNNTKRTENWRTVEQQRKKIRRPREPESIKPELMQNKETLKTNTQRMERETSDISKQKYKDKNIWQTFILGDNKNTIDKTIRQIYWIR